MVETAKIIIAYRVEEQKINDDITLLRLINKGYTNSLNGSEPVNLEEFSLDQVTYIKTSENNEDFINIKEDTTFKGTALFAKPIKIVRIGLPIDISNPENIKVNYFDLPANNDSLYIGVKLNSEMKMPFIILDTSEGAKIISVKDVYDIKPEVGKEKKSTKRKRKKSKKSKKHKRAKATSKKRKTKNKSSRKSRRV